MKDKKTGKFLKTHGMYGTQIYKSWSSMKSRCLNKNNKDHKDYGGRGITVCDSWLIFENFYADMGDRPQGKTLDRKNNDKGYCKSNCKWSTPKEQSNNMRKNCFLTYQNKTLSIRQWSEKLDIKYETIKSRLRYGWSVEEALTTKKYNK